jgi:hypothetical protein
MAPKIVRNVHNLVHRALRDAVRWGFVGRNVADAANPPAGKSPERSIWTPDELRAFIEHVRDERLGHATVAITLDVYSHVIPGMDELAATTVAELILGDGPANRTPERPVDRSVTSKWVSIRLRKWYWLAPMDVGGRGEPSAAPAGRPSP